MRRLTKKIAAAVLALTMVLAVGTTCCAATWTGYFGATEGWYEGVDGALASESATGFTANVNMFGWGGVWGGQIKKPLALKKGTSYNITFNMKSTKVNKYVYVKMSTDENLATSFWVFLPAGQNVKVTKTFKALNNANQLTFGIGGDLGNREDTQDDKDAAVRYKLFTQQFKADYATTLNEVEGGITAEASQIIVSNFAIKTKPAKAKISSVKAGKKKITVKIKKVKGADGYQIKVGSKKKATTKTKYVFKGLKSKKKYTVKVRAYVGNKSLYGAWSNGKKVKVK